MRTTCQSVWDWQITVFCFQNFIGLNVQGLYRIVVEGNNYTDMSESPDPQSVGRELVRQYYTMLNERPECLHRFFSHNSSYVHGGIEKPGEELPPVKGQVAIHQKIMSLGFKDCHAKIRQVDCQETVAGAVVIQVTGELSNNYGPMRRFMQTFVLARQSAKMFYLHNDIFRYQDEVFHDYDITADVAENHEALDEHIAMNSEVVVGDESCDAPTSQASVISLPAESVEINEAGSSHVQPPSETNAATLASAVETLNVSEPSNDATVDTPVVPSADETVSDNKTESSEVAESEPRAKLPVQKPISWASLAGKGTASSSHSTGQAPVAPKPQATIKPERKADSGPSNQTQTAPLPQRPVRSGPKTEQPVIGDAAAERKWPSSYDSGDSKSSAAQLVPDNQQLFVGNIPHNAEDKDLIDFFSKYGTVVDVKINRKGMTRDLPNFGFVSFDAPEAVTKALAGKPLLLYGRHRLNVEEKKEQSELFSRPRGGSRGGRGINSYRGSYRGGRGSHFSAPVHSGDSNFNSASSH